MKSSQSTFWNWPWLEAARRRDTARYGFSLFCTLGAVLAWAVMDTPLDDPTPYQVMLPFVALAAWFGGSGPGILATAASALWAVTHSDGEFVSLHQQLELLLFFPIGAIISAICGSLVVARQQAQLSAEELSASQARYRSIVETASEGIWMTGPDFTTTFVNERMATLLGTTANEMVGRKVSDFLFDQDKDVPARNIAQHFEQGYYDTESRYRHSNGSVIWFQVNVSVLRDTAGNLTGYLALHTDVTERRRHDEELQRSNARYERATQAVAGFIYEQEIRTGEVYRSTGFLDVMGYAPKLTPPTSGWWREQLHELDMANYDSMSAISVREGEQFSLEYRARHADGSYRWLWDRGLVVRGENGEAECIVGFISDISARRSAETALRESEANFRQLADAMPQIVWSSNPRGVPDYFNRRWYEYSGQTEGTVGLDSWETFYHPDDAERVRADWEEAMANRVAFRCELRLRDKNGSYRWFLCRANPVCDASSGDVTRWFGTATDIDEQKRATDAQTFLAEVGVLLSGSLDPQVTLEQVTQLAVPHLGDWCFVALKNREGAPEMVAAAHHSNQHVEAFWERYARYGLDADAKKGMSHVIRTGTPEVVERLGDTEIAEALTQPEYQAEFAKVGHHSTLAVPLEVRGEILGAIGFTYAESDRYFTTADLPLAQELARRAAIAIENARLYRQLQDADRRKDEFLAMLAHELRNPLAAISGARSLMDEMLEGEARILTGTPRAILERQVSQLSRLVDDLLDVSRITRGKIELRRKEVDFAEIVKNALDGVRPLILSRRHNLIVELPGEAVKVDADPARLGQIVSNLVTNAAKYTDLGGEIVVRLEKEGQEAVLGVRDNGTGLSSEMLQSIWGLFVQSDRTLERSQGGLGIGLTLVRSLTEMHGGRVAAASEGIGKGSQFTVVLPMLAPVEESAVTKKVSRANNHSDGYAKSRVLVVDDNEDAAMMLCAWLEKNGHDVQVAHDGAQGLVLACGWQPDVALLDIGMPGMDGYQVARQLRSLPEGKGMRLIAVTGYGQPADRDLALEAGFDSHLTKPVDLGELVKVMEGEI
jgi:PAS domain S-box-containing protein